MNNTPKLPKVTDKSIITFLRFKKDRKGEVTATTEKVSWFKRDDGSKYVNVEPFNAGRMDIQMMQRSQHQEITL